MKSFLSIFKIYKDDSFEKSDLKRIAAFFVAPFCLTLILFAMAILFGKQPLVFLSQAWYAKIIITYVFVLSLQGFVFAFCHRGFLSFTVTAAIVYIFEFITQTMYLLTGDPLLPTDLLMAGDLGKIARFVKIPVTISEIFGLLSIGAVIYYYVKLNRKTQRKKTGVVFKAFTSILLVVFFVNTSYLLSLDRDFRNVTLKKFDVSRRAFNPIEDYQASGSLLTFLPRIGDMFIDVPEDYTKDSVEEALRPYKEKAGFENDIKPNVIAIQNEAWWDPTNIKHAKFSLDPMALFHEYERDKAHVKTGFIKTPVFAGGTCMPEFEFLTGMSTLNLPSNTYPYIQSVKGETASFVQEYRKNGYDTIAIHPYKKNFYERDAAYSYLGFDTFLGDEDMTFTAKKGFYISDESASKEIIKAFEEKKNERAYIFCVTMQNHGGYTPARYDSYDLSIESYALTDEDKICLTDFSQGVLDSMNAFKILTDYFAKIEEPTLIVMYGDHLPLLGASGETYINGGMIDEEYLEAYSSSPNLYETPFIIWANYNIQNINIYDVLSPAALGLEIYKMSGLDNTPDYYKLFDSIYTPIPVYHNQGLMMANKKPFGDEHHEKFIPIIKSYMLVQYDLLHGKKYAFK